MFQYKLQNVAQNVWHMGIGLIPGVWTMCFFLFIVVLVYELILISYTFLVMDAP